MLQKCAESICTSLWNKLKQYNFSWQLCRSQKVDKSIYNRACLCFLFVCMCVCACVCAYADINMSGTICHGDAGLFMFATHIHRNMYCV